MKQLFWIFALVLCYYTPVKAMAVNQDSLIRLVRETTDKKLKADIYRNLADINLEKPEEQKYLKLLYELAKETKSKELILGTLKDLAYSYIAKDKIDSVFYYMKMIKQESNAKTENKYLSFLRMKLFDLRMNKGKEEMEEDIAFELELFRKSDKNDIYIQIEREYVLGGSLIDSKKNKEAILHFEQACQLTKKLSDPEDIIYRITTEWLYANNFINIGESEKCIELLEGILELYKTYYKSDYFKKRPYYNVERRYLQCYASLLMYAEVLPKEKLEYYVGEIKKIGIRVTEPFDKYNYLLAVNNYYLFIEDYPNALEIINQQLEILQTLAPAYLPGKYKLQSVIYDEMGDYKNALIKYKKYVELKDSLTSKERQEQLNTLQVEYEVDKLKFEKANLENRNKLILLITLSVILLLAVAICIYLYYHLKKEKQMKIRLYHLNQKAGESERMKTEFMNSMCHEIRTPLNAIVGFTSVIVDDSYDNESKAEFSELINTNTALLTSLIDDLLIVSNLDSSKELLPCKIENINDICLEEFRKSQGNSQKSIGYVLDLPEEEILFPTSAKHLSIVIGNLLSNASKFTQEGCITLGLQKNRNTNGILIKVSDTGCGIPFDKQEVVFERFMKLDSFTQGNGLGLFLCKLIVSRLAGSIYVDSSYTGGACFIISLPVLQINQEVS